MQTRTRERIQFYPPGATRREALQGNWLFPCSLVLVTVIAVSGLRVVGPTWASAIFQPLELRSLQAKAALCAAFLVVFILHEAGHLAAAIAMRFRVLSLALGPFRITRLYGKLTLTFSAKSVFAASISAIPVTNNRWRGQMMAVIAAGPLATFFSAAGAACLLRCFATSSCFRTGLSSLEELSLIIFFLSLIPNGKSARIRNDAQLFWCVLRDSVEAEEIRLYHRIMQLRTSGVRPRDYPEPLIQSLAANQCRPDMSLFYAETIMEYAIDRGDIDLADAWDRRAMELQKRCDKRQQQLAIAQSGCFDILFRDNLASARGKFTKVKISAISPPWLRHRIKAAERLAAGRTAEAMAEVSRASSFFPEHLLFYDFERNLLDQLEQKAFSVAVISG